MNRHVPVRSGLPTDWGALARLRDAPAAMATWMQTHWPQIAVAVGVAAALYLLLRLLRRWGMRLCRKGEGVATWYGVAGRALSRTGRFFMLAVAARLASSVSGAPPFLDHAITFLFTIAVAIQMAIWARELIFGAVEHRTHDDVEHSRGLASALGIIRLLVTVALFAIAVVVILANLGVNVAGLLAGLGVGGIAIGLAAQGIFADLFAALAIIFDRPFRLGDSISYDNGSSSGTVEAIGLKSTRLRGANGEQRIIANRKLLDFEILNTTRRARNRFKFDFHLGFDTDPEHVRRLPAMLRHVVESQGYMLVHGGLNGLSRDGLSYDVEFESSGTDFPPEARDQVAAALLDCCAAQGIALAYPTSVNRISRSARPALHNGVPLGDGA